MIPGFENYTHELTEYELEKVVPLVVKHLQHNIGKENIVANGVMCSKLKAMYNVKISPERMRIIIRHIRITGEIMCLVASGKGYFVARTEEEMGEYLDSLRIRIDAQEYMFKAMLWQSKNAILE